MSAELDRMEDALGHALAALARAEAQVWRGPAARAYGQRLEEVRAVARQLRGAVGAVRPAVTRVLAARATAAAVGGPGAPGPWGEW